MPDDAIDLLIVGGGINGTAIARDAAGRGLSVVLAERDDLANGVTSRSTKLIQGGFHDLARGAFGHVRTALAERNVLFRNAPHVVRPTRFVVPHDEALRSATRTMLELWLYDRLGHQAGLPKATRIELHQDPARDLFKPQFKTGFTFTDGICDDSRLVVLNAVDASEHGAEIATRTRVTAARRANGIWYALLHRAGRPTRAIRARALVNATGPWTAAFASEALEAPPAAEPPRLVRGGHLLVPMAAPESSVYVLPGRAGSRPVYIVPYQGFALIGPVACGEDADPGAEDIDDTEARDLLDTVGHFFAQPPGSADVAFTFASVWVTARRGLEPLDEAAIDLDHGPDRAPLITIRGGSLGLHRRLAERVLTRLQPLLGFAAGPWTAHAPLPGGDLGGIAFDDFLSGLQMNRSWLPVSLAERWARTYGTRAGRILADAQSLGDLGEAIGDGLFEAEVDYLRRVEFAVTEEDILWRRTKLGLETSEATGQRLRTILEASQLAAA
jgi:glycerol-3-phosphate dehydrogenase